MARHAMTEDEIIFDSRTTGSRYATRVRVTSPQGSVFDGRTGVVSRKAPSGEWGSTVMVRLDAPYVGVEMPFGRGELEVIR